MKITAIGIDVAIDHLEALQPPVRSLPDEETRAMATFSTTRHNPTIKNFYQRLLAQGKKKKAVLTACMASWAKKSLLLLAGLSLTAFAQPSSKGTITGRVVSDEGAGIPGITVRLTPTGATRLGQVRSTSSDDEGNFRFNDLPAQVYAVETFGGRAFVPAPKSAAERAEPRRMRIGDSVTLTMIRGGVITGRVINSAGEGLIAMPLMAIMVRDADGNPVTSQSSPFTPRAASDDRGVYRFFGLTPGTYVVLANYGNPYWDSQASLYDNEAPTYYSSSTRDAAIEIQVVSGGEASGIDIRYRGERGHAISGKLVGAKESVNVELLHVATQTVIATKYVFGRGGETGYEFFGVPDGDYELIAREDGNESAAASSPRKVTVRGADVAGLELRLLPLGSIAGRVVIETAQGVCEKPPSTTLEEILVTARPEEKPRAEADPVSRPNSSEAAVNSKGEFELRKLTTVRHRLALNLPNEHLYLKSVLLPTAKPATDLARSGVSLKQGEKLSGVTVTLAEGAASLRGKVTVSKEGVRLPSRVRIHLLPIEPTAADDLLRYAEKIAASDGAFTFTNLAPGKYWLLARTVADNEPVDRPPSPVAWDNAERLKLRRAAEAAKNEIELKPCQREKDYVLRLP